MGVLSKLLLSYAVVGLALGLHNTVSKALRGYPIRRGETSRVVMATALWPLLLMAKRSH